MKAVTCILLFGLIAYLYFMATGSTLWCIKCLYLVPSMIFTGYLSWLSRSADKWMFTGLSAFTVFFFVAALANLCVISNPYYSLGVFIGLSFALTLFSRK